MRGIYFLANDTTRDLVIAFLNSLRKHNPGANLCLVPYDDGATALEDLATEFNFFIWRDQGALHTCDTISRSFHAGQCLGHYRKLALWEGPFSEFAYVDVDTIVLHDLTRLYAILSDYDYVGSHSHISAIRQFVWKDGIETYLTKEQIAFSTNTGFFLSKKGVLPLLRIEQKAKEALALINYLQLMCAEQPLLNYIVVTSGRPYTSLSYLRKQSGRVDLPLEYWAGHFDGKIVDGKVVVSGKPAAPLLVHWAGMWRENQHRTSEVWNYFRYLREGL